MNRVRSATGSGTPSGATEAYLGSGNVARTPTGRPEASRGRPLIVRRRRVSSPFRRVPRSRVRPPGSFPSSSGSSGWRPTPRTRMRVMRFVSCRARLATSHRLMSASTWAAPTDGVDPSGTIGTGRGRAARVSASGGVRRFGARPPPRHAGRSFSCAPVGRSPHSLSHSLRDASAYAVRSLMSPMSSSGSHSRRCSTRAPVRGFDTVTAGATLMSVRVNAASREASPASCRAAADEAERRPEDLLPANDMKRGVKTRRGSSRASPRTAARGPCAPPAQRHRPFSRTVRESPHLGPRARRRYQK